MHPYYVMRAVGGAIFNLGTWIMLFNVVMTVRQASARGVSSVAARA
jgi:cytochrome c oxidase cbb3-type subunit 1